MGRLLRAPAHALDGSAVVDRPGFALHTRREIAAAGREPAGFGRAFHVLRPA